MKLPVRILSHVRLNLIRKQKLSLQRKENYYFCYLKLFFLLNFIRITFLEISKRINLLWEISSVWWRAKPSNFPLICKSIIHSKMEKRWYLLWLLLQIKPPKTWIISKLMPQNCPFRIPFHFHHSFCVETCIHPSHTTYKNYLCNSFLKQLYAVTPQFTYRLPFYQHWCFVSTHYISSL